MPKLVKCFIACIGGGFVGWMSGHAYAPTLPLPADVAILLSLFFGALLTPMGVGCYD